MFLASCQHGNGYSCLTAKFEENDHIKVGGCSLKLHIDLGQQGFDLGLGFGRVAFGTIDEL